ncbi:hypothetical protein PUN28_000843 [Cardiocondyla obscurior]|uniref:Single domain-containing protein n=1 Tax=Cardiocondyla obscurior TaxID=286306 RepID=A0AAW2H1D3_9HYME
MKSYILAILLVMTMCGMIHSATQVFGQCLFGRVLLTPGEHTGRPCSKLICDNNGQITVETCPMMTSCRNGTAIGWRPEIEGLPYPLCCAHPICTENGPRALP